jgi:DNA-directed RNA polymerase specialized sigma24 family protein
MSGPSPSTAAFVFISYSSKDTDLVDRLKTDLTRSGVKVWLDHEQLTPGMSNWHVMVRKGISQAMAMIYVASDTAAISDVVIDEIEIARDEGKLVIPFWIRGEKWRNCTPLGWGTTQYIDGRGTSYREGLTKLLTRLRISGLPVQLISLGFVEVNVADATILPDPRDSRTLVRLHKRTSGGGYEISDAEVVRAIRAWDARGTRPVAMSLCALLVERCMPEFQRHAAGLRHHPDLMDDTMNGMIEQLIREALDPREVFMTQNFIHYLRCLCADNFTQTLRQEGLKYKRKQRFAEQTAAQEMQRILAYLPDPLDQQIMVLRVLEGRQWEEIAKLCGKTERTVRLRYEKARMLLQERLMAEVDEQGSDDEEQSQ